MSLPIDNSAYSASLDNSAYLASLDNGIAAVRYRLHHSVRLFPIGFLKTAVRTRLCFLYRTAECLQLIG
jgi:hypothetical protein